MNPASWLLADPSPCLRWLVLRDIYRLPEHHPEMAELSSFRYQDRMVKGILSLQDSDGSWKPDSLFSGKAGSTSILSTAYALTRLGYLGFNHQNKEIVQGAEFLFRWQEQDGSWKLAGEYDDMRDAGNVPAREHYSMIPLQTAYPLRGLVSCGYATDPRAERAYDWLLSQRLEDGAWPTGIAAGVYGYVAGYRRLPHSRWGCRSNTTGALICLSLHPERRKSREAQRALDLLLGRETRDTYALGHEISRLVGAEPPHGFISYFARFDMALMLDLCGRIGASLSDNRVSSLRGFVESQRSPYGLWDYPSHPQVARWISFDLMRSIARLDNNVDWTSLEPRTPFQPYPKIEKRF